MSSSLDMSLDDIIRKNKGYGDGGGGGGRNNNFRDRGRGGGRGRGRGAGSGPAPGPSRRFVHRDPVRARPYPMPPTIMREPVIMACGGGSSGDSSTKLYVSNLEYSVSNEDIKLLFSDVGELKRYSIHYDKSGRSKGTAEVVFAHQGDALAAINRYNNVQLDGKPMKIELVGVNLFTPAPVPLPHLPMPLIATSNFGKHNRVFRSGQESMGTRGQGHGGVHGRGYTRGQRQGTRHGLKLTADELDADLERYHFEAMQIS